MIVFVFLLFLLYPCTSLITYKLNSLEVTNRTLASYPNYTSKQESFVMAQRLLANSVPPFASQFLPAHDYMDEESLRKTVEIDSGEL